MPGDFKDHVLTVNIPRNDLKVVVDGVAYDFSEWMTRHPGGAAVQLTSTASGYTLQGTFVDAGSGQFEMDIWRAGQGQVAQLLLFNRPGKNCLAGGNATDLAFPQAGADIYTWASSAPTPHGSAS